MFLVYSFTFITSGAYVPMYFRIKYKHFLSKRVLQYPSVHLIAWTENNYHNRFEARFEVLIKSTLYPKSLIFNLIFIILK